MPKSSPQRSPSRRLTILYIASLSTVALCSILGQILVQHMLHKQADDAQVVSAAEKQQMLTVQLSQAALAVKLTVDPQEQQQQLEEFQATIAKWETSRQEFQKLEARVSYVGPNKQQMQPKMREIDQSSQVLLNTANTLVNETQTQSGREGLPILRARQTRRILLTEQDFMKNLDWIIVQYNQQMQARVAQLRLLELILLGVTLTVLLLEGLLVFRPAVKQIHQTLAALGQSLTETQETAHKLAAEQQQSERLLLNILPSAIAKRLKKKQSAIADGFSETTVLFADIVGFTQLSDRLPPQELVSLLNQIFSRFDHLAELHRLEKIKTIGDAYMVVGGLPEPRADHAIAVAQMALDMQQEISNFNSETGESFKIRIGINSGPVIAGVIGIKKFIYDLWGDTVNVASRMESHGLPDCIQVTEATYELLKDQYLLEERGVLTIKGKGEMLTYLLKGKR